MPTMPGNCTHMLGCPERRYAVKDSAMAFSPTPLGEALVGGYRDMQLNNLWLPSLRARIEQNITLVAQGRRTKVCVCCNESRYHW